MILKYFTAFTAAFAASLSINAEILNISAGSLQHDLSSLKTSESALYISGNADARDLAQLRSLPENIYSLDISNLNILKFSDSKPRFFNRTFFDSNAIPDYCFFNVKLKAIALPVSLQSIGNGAFAGSEIESVVIPDYVSSIGNFAFYDCKNLVSVTLPANISSIGRGAFGNSSALKSIDLSHTSISEIPDACFAGCSSLVSVILPPGISKIGKEAFRGTAISSLNLSNVSELSPYALSGMYSLKEISLNPSAKIGEGALMDNTSLQYIKGSPSSIPDLFAANCSNLDASSGVSSSSVVGRYAFANNQASSIILSGNLSFIDKYAFYGNASLASIDASALGDYVPDVDPDAFAGIDCPSVKLFVKGNEEAWKAHPQWSQFNISANDTTGVDSIDATPLISTLFQGDILFVSAPDPLKDIYVYSLDGRLLLHSSPLSSNAEISLSDITENILLVNIFSDSANKSLKLVR